MTWIKWVLIFVVAALALRVLSGKKDLKSLGKSKPITAKEATNTGRRPSGKQKIIQLK